MVSVVIGFMDIVLLHGPGYRDDMALLASWGRIPNYLSQAWAKVFQGGLEAWGSIENNAAGLKVIIEKILGY
jgi:triacylglycerol lipase